VILLLLNNIAVSVVDGTLVSILGGLGQYPRAEVSSNSATKDVLVEDIGDSKVTVGNSKTESPYNDAEYPSDELCRLCLTELKSGVECSGIAMRSCGFVSPKAFLRGDDGADLCISIVFRDLCELNDFLASTVFESIAIVDT
jgi:hypothetical protein